MQSQHPSMWGFSSQTWIIVQELQKNQHTLALTLSMAVSLKHSADDTMMKVFMQSMFSVVCCMKLMVFAQAPQSHSLILLRSKHCKITIMVTCLYLLSLIHLNAKPRSDTRFLQAPFPTRRSPLRQGGEGWTLV